MRKISALFVAAALVVAASVSTMAAGINSAEQSVLDELNTTVNMNGTKLVISDSYKTSAKNYFETIEMTDKQAQDTIAAIKKGEALLESSKASSIKGMTKEDKQTLLSYGQEAVATVGLTLTYDTTEKKVIISDSEGVVFENSAVLVEVKEEPTKPVDPENPTKPVDPEKPTQAPTKATDPNAIKTTGTNVNTSAVAGASAVAVLMAAAGATYVVKTRKERA